MTPRPIPLPHTYSAEYPAIFTNLTLGPQKGVSMTAQPIILPHGAVPADVLRTLFLGTVAQNLANIQIEREDEMSTHSQKMSSIEENIENGGAEYWRKQARAAQRLIAEQLETIQALQNRVAYLERVRPVASEGKLEEGR